MFLQHYQSMTGPLLPASSNIDPYQNIILIYDLSIIVQIDRMIYFLSCEFIIVCKYFILTVKLPAVSMLEFFSLRLNFDWMTPNICRIVTTLICLSQIITFYYRLVSSSTYIPLFDNLYNYVMHASSWLLTKYLQTNHFSWRNSCDKYL